MKVCYLGRRSARSRTTPQGAGDVIELLSDNWDDFGFKTSFATVCRLGGELVDIGAIRLLVDGYSNSASALDKLLAAGWDGTFPPPDLDYISVPLEITFYQQVKGHVGGAKAIEVAQALRDASLLIHNLDESAQRLVSTEGFKKSLQRERGGMTAYNDGWKVLEDLAIAVQDFEFSFVDVFDETSTLALNFDSAALLPHDINVLIGPNGVGKSRVLHKIVRAWIKPDGGDRGLGFAKQPNLSQVVVVSYSPFERFPVDMEGLTVQDKDVYRYFGFRGRSFETKRVRISHEFPKTNAAESLIACLADDQKYAAIEHWARKVSTLETVLRSAFQFDFAAVEIEEGKRIRALFDDIDKVEGPTYVELEGRRYVPIATHTMGSANPQRLLAACSTKSGVAFFKDGNPIELSSGQRLFAYIVVNLLGAIRRNSLVLIDEPELFLHPTLEIQFIEMLKEILASFNSKALLATHSEVVVREVPADCVHVFERTDEGLAIKHPPFETFGGDIQRISSYVFGDNAVSKPFEKWLRLQLQEHGSAKALIKAMGDNLNEELVVQIKAMDADDAW